MNSSNIMDANSFLAAMYLLKEMALRSDLLKANNNGNNKEKSNKTNSQNLQR